MVSWDTPPVSRYDFSPNPLFRDSSLWFSGSRIRKNTNVEYTVRPLGP